MLKSLLHWRLRAFERRYDYDAGYLHEIADIDAAGLVQFQRFTAVGQHGGGLPGEVLFAARIAAALHEDCGPCVQVVINMALEAGVEAALIKALATNRLDGAASQPALAFRFARAVLAGSPEVDTLRPAVIDTFGPRGPFCLALALSVGRSYPVMKRAMGYARHCQQVEIAGQRIATGH